MILIALGSGLTYAFVLTGIRSLPDVSPAWITFCNLLVAALVLLPFVMAMPLPTTNQLLILLMFGVFQLGLPYLMTAKSLKIISPQEAGILTLLELRAKPRLGLFDCTGERCALHKHLDGRWIIACSFILALLSR